MSDENAVIESILRRYRRAVVVGLSADPSRPSHGVARYLLRHGYEVVPVNPHLDAWEGRPAHPELGAVPADPARAASEPPLGLVVVFRRSDQVAAVAEQALARGVGAFWMQQGIRDASSARRLREAGTLVVEDRCLAVEHSLRRAALGLS